MKTWTMSQGPDIRSDGKYSEVSKRWHGLMRQYQSDDSEMKRVTVTQLAVSTPLRCPRMARCQAVKVTGHRGYPPRFLHSVLHHNNGNLTVTQPRNIFASIFTFILTKY